MKKIVQYALLASTSVSAMPATAYAQSSGSPSPVDDSSQTTVGIEDIVVTARRQEESLQTVPVAVTALSSDQIMAAQVTEITDLQRTAPSLSVATGAPSAGSFAFVAIRGQGSLNASISVDPAVAVYVDGVYIARPSQGQVEMTDLARAEILRGPQGTLFGRNTIGGALNILTTDPQDEFEARLSAGYGNYDTWNAGGMVNVPLGDALALRVNYDYKERDGYGFNPTLNRPAADLKAHAVRGKLKWSSGDWDVMLAGDYNKQSDSGQIITLKAANPFSPLGGIFPADDPATPAPEGPSLADIMNGFAHNKSNWYETNGTGYSPNANVPLLAPYNRLEAYGGSLTINGNLGAVGIKSITAYRFSNAEGFIDLDATPFPVLATESGYLSKAWSQEVQINAPVSDALNIIGGLYFSDEKGVEFSNFQALGLFKDLLPPAVGYVARNDADVFNTTYGVYLQGYYQLTDRLRAAAGLRWTWDKRKVELHNMLVSGAPGDTVYFNAAAGAFTPNCVVVPDTGNPAACTQTNSVNFDYPAWTFGLDYQAADGLFLYAKTSRASHAGGWNLRIGSVPAFNPEELTDVEFGFKADMLDRRVRLNVAAFHSWVKGSQREATFAIGTPPVSTSFITNAGDIQIDGVEAELIAQPWRGMEIRGNLAHLSGRFDRGSFIDASGDRSMEKIVQLPRVQYSIGVTQTVPVGSGEFNAHVDYSYVSSQYFFTNPVTPGNGSAAQAAFGKVPGYGVLNGRLAFQLTNPGIEVSLWGRNLINKKYVTRSFPGIYRDLGVATEFVGDPRTYGVSLTWRFGG